MIWSGRAVLPLLTYAALLMLQPAVRELPIGVATRKEQYARGALDGGWSKPTKAFARKHGVESSCTSNSRLGGALVLLGQRTTAVKVPVTLALSGDWVLFRTRRWTSTCCSRPRMKFLPTTTSSISPRPVSSKTWALS